MEKEDFDLLLDTEEEIPEIDSKTSKPLKRSPRTKSKLHSKDRKSKVQTKRTKSTVRLLDEPLDEKRGGSRKPKMLSITNSEEQEVGEKLQQDSFSSAAASDSMSSRGKRNVKQQQTITDDMFLHSEPSSSDATAVLVHLVHGSLRLSRRFAHDALLSQVLIWVRQETGCENVSDIVNSHTLTKLNGSLLVRHMKTAGMAGRTVTLITRK